MMAPFFKYGLFGDEISLVVAFVTGIGFGFMLESAGFGNARILAAQFYFRDLRVLKVMFTAIVTAMVGVFVLARFGVLDLSLVYLTPTFLVPQIVGGLVLGAGFIVGGYCPGTSCVSAATGRIDGMVYVAGMIGGLAGFAEVYPYLGGFVRMTALGQLTLPRLLNVPYGLLVFAVIVMALGAFVAAEWAEKKIGGQVPDAGALLAPTRRLTPVRLAAATLLAIGFVAIFVGSPYRGPFARIDPQQLALDAGSGADRVSADQIAQWLIEGRNDFVLVDLRDAAAFAKYHIPSAVNVPLAALGATFARNDRLVLYADTGVAAAQGWMLLRSLGYPAVRMIVGGLAEWESQVLFPKTPLASAPAAEQIDFARRAAVAKHFGGAAQGTDEHDVSAPPALPQLVAPPAPAPAAAPVAPRRKKEGC